MSVSLNKADDAVQIQLALISHTNNGKTTLARTLVGVDADGFQPQMIVVAHDISPADMLQFRDRSFIGFVTDVGGQNSHTAIVARSLDIPAAVGMSQASRLIEQDDWVIIDGDAGVVIANPSQLVLEQYRQRQVMLQKACSDCTASG